MFAHVHDVRLEMKATIIYHAGARLACCHVCIACEVCWGSQDPAQGVALGNRLGLFAAKLAAPSVMSAAAGCFGGRQHLHC